MRFLSLAILLFASPAWACDYVARARLASYDVCAPAAFAAPVYYPAVNRAFIQRDVYAAPIVRQRVVVRQQAVYAAPAFAPVYAAPAVQLNINARARLFGGRSVVRQRTVVRGAAFGY